jgi:hypothetical protein
MVLNIPLQFPQVVFNQSSIELYKHKYSSIDINLNHMTKLILILLFITAICIPVSSQNTFEVIIGSDLDECLINAVQDNYGNYYFVGFLKETIYSQECGYLVKVDDEGEILNEMTFCILDSAFFLSGLICFNDTLFIIGVKESSLTGNHNIIAKLILDLDLNILKNEVQIILPGYNNIITSSLLYNNNRFILTGMAEPDSNSQDLDVFLFEMDHNLDSLNCKADARVGMQVGYDILANDDPAGYKIFGNGTYPGTYSSYSEIIFFDSSLNFISVDSIPWHLYLQLSARTYDNSSYLLSGSKSIINSTLDDVGIIKLSNSDQLLASNRFGKPPDTVNVPGVQHNIDFTSKNNIFLGGTTNFVIPPYPFQSENSWIMLNNLDSNLNLRWQQFYGGDAFYHLWGILATQDGGCLMYAMRYDENTQFEERDVYILKVDSAGLLTSTGEGPQIPVQQLAIVPNPALDNVSIRYPDIFGYDDKEIEIYNSQGIPVISLSATQDLTETRVDVSGLPVGLYFVVLKVEGRKVATGKMVKI